MLVVEYQRYFRKNNLKDIYRTTKKTLCIKLTHRVTW